MVIVNIKGDYIILKTEGMSTEYKKGLFKRYAKIQDTKYILTRRADFKNTIWIAKTNKTYIFNGFVAGDSPFFKSQKEKYLKDLLETMQATEEAKNYQPQKINIVPHFNNSKIENNTDLKEAMNKLIKSLKYANYVRVFR